MHATFSTVPGAVASVLRPTPLSDLTATETGGQLLVRCSHRRLSHPPRPQASFSPNPPRAGRDQLSPHGRAPSRGEAAAQ